MKIKVTPANGARVLDPATKQPIPADGKTVTRSSYWLRRQKDGEVTITATKTTKTKKGD